jgi:ATP-dependent DNA helicase RecQ
MTFSSALAHSLLARHFGYAAFREGQEDIIRSVVNGHDTFVLMPTGGGKSLCYQVPAMMLDGTAIVISPLIALMQDQVAALDRAGVRACFINSTLPFAEIRQRLNDARFGKYKLIYVAPERLGNKAFLDALSLVHISFLAIDEAHCVSEWGHDFRPAYLNLPAATAVIAAGQGIERLPMVALTATATPEVQDDIITTLGMGVFVDSTSSSTDTNEYIGRNSTVRFVRGFNRPNLVYRVEREGEKTARLGDLVRDSERQSGSTIVYCGSRRRVDEFASALAKINITAEAYHAGRSDKTRQSVLERFLSGELPTIVATNAFGMGVDKANVRNVVHCDLTQTLEAYYQEAGRAGRDGATAHCTLLYEPRDRKLMDFFVSATYPEEQVLERVVSGLYDFAQIPMGAKPLTPLLLDETMLGNRIGVAAPVVNSMLNLFERYGILRRGSTQGTARIQFLATVERLREYYEQIPAPRRAVLNALYRTVGARAHEEMVEFDIHTFWQKHAIATAQFDDALRSLEYGRIVRYEAPGTAGGITLLMERMPLRRFPVDWQAFDERRARAVAKLDAVQHYAETHECKRNVILQYFGEFTAFDPATSAPAQTPSQTPEQPDDTLPSASEGSSSLVCGVCSSCVQEQKRRTETTSPRMEFLRQAVLACAVELDGRFGKTVMADVLKGNKSAEKVQKFRLTQATVFGAVKEFAKVEILEAINRAVSDGLLAVSRDQYPTVSIRQRGSEFLRVHPSVLKLRSYNRDECLYPELLETCKALRKEFASREHIPEQALLDDRSLLTLINALPANREELRRALPQAGGQFLSRFAPTLLQAVSVFATNRAAQSGQDLQGKGSSVHASVALARDGLTLEHIAQQRGLALGTIAQHLADAIESGAVLPREHLVADDDYAQILRYCRVHKQALLKDVRAALNLACDWAVLRVGVAFARREILLESLSAEKK